MNTERQGRARRRETERAASKGRRPKGRQRLYMALSALGLLVSVGGGMVYEYFNSDNYVIGSEIKRLGVEKSQEEIDLWRGVDREISESAANGTLTPAERLNIITGAMDQSRNPIYYDTAKFLVDQKNIGRVGTSLIARRLSDNGIVHSSVEVTPDGNLGIGLIVSIPAMLEMGPQEMASALSHEKEHIKNAFETDKPVENRPIGERIENQARRIKDRNEFLAEEARGYMQQSQSVIYELGLMGESDYSAVIRRSFAKTSFDALVNAAKVRGDASAPGWKNFLRRTFRLN